ncbi:hypothetical protein GCM10009774_22570 [Cellulomonas gelida]|uniref:Uncharacterized protein n=1 Tax=Cellulomonas gelida TaxID=1712 RepID=A0A4Y3KLB5_9CELL|nr:hypothetical protein CGE01nite_09690 [Cellulomonas gelida]GGL31589.1 hypothetical protein GCM10009774_22570 [Cellulomonas gelida]
MGAAADAGRTSPAIVPAVNASVVSAAVAARGIVIDILRSAGGFAGAVAEPKGNGNVAMDPM